MIDLSLHQKEIEAKIQAIKTNSGDQLPGAQNMKIENLQEAWSALISRGGTVGCNYLHHLIDRIEVDENQITIFPKEVFISEPENRKENATL